MEFKNKNTPHSGCCNGQRHVVVVVVIVVVVVVFPSGTVWWSAGICGTQYIVKCIPQGEGIAFVTVIF